VNAKPFFPRLARIRMPGGRRVERSPFGGETAE
jgi:hypothetical protein